jgi:rSAM/selenodomain-associated transferase 2
MRISVVIPALNEALALPETLHALQGQAGEWELEVVVVDGGSHDATQSIAHAAGLRVLTGACGRSAQMNQGAEAATGEVLLFLHADTVLPSKALQLIANTISEGFLWGHFDVQIQGVSPMLKIVALCMNMRSRLTGITTGDQAIFVTRGAFQSIGGFLHQPLMEDIELSRSLKRLMPPACLHARVTTSGRRWESRGVWRTVLLMWRLRLAYWSGVPVERLASLYQ